MSGIAEALRRIELQQQTISRSLLAAPIDASRECKRLTDVAADFARRASEPRKLKPPLDPQKVWRDWAAMRFDPHGLDARQLKSLCVSPDTATRQEFIGAMRQNAAPLNRTSCLMGLILSYFARWGAIKQQGEMESLIVTILRSYSRRNPLLRKYRADAERLFQSGAAELIASWTVKELRPTKPRLADLHVGLATNLAAATLSEASRCFRSLWHPVSESAGLARLKYAFDDILVPELATRDFQAVVSDLILSDWVERFPAVRDALRAYVLHHQQLGDPRLQAKNWAGMCQPATAKFLQWIARESIVFFFNHVLPDNSTNERRKDFWLEYLATIKDFQVALSWRDYARFDASRPTEVPRFARTDHDTTSAFIMRFGVRGGSDVVIVEFSQTGNAAHIFPALKFELQAGKVGNTRFEFSKLKHEADDKRIIHVGDWEPKARNKLAGWGVRR